MKPTVSPVRSRSITSQLTQLTTAKSGISLNNLFRIAQEAEYKVERVAKALESSPSHFWQYCATTFHCTPKVLLDLARGDAFIKRIMSEREIKCVLLKKMLGFKSDSAFNAFAARVFSCTPETVKFNPKRAKLILEQKLSEIEDRLKIGDNEREGKKRRMIKENRNAKPKEKTERENRKRKPKEKTENDFP
ncbi:MAG: hypothetical protein SFU91_03540 [Chloroherpetonaceae bacterium]|nr:hypothetical protein [Chloroherpetonaceae bacterium]